ncbi:MAG: YjbH domain-containing protein [Candidatus Eisenbacteria bacterium]|nr:YjbH domain-containing protein [Candidatus Eisenbacteria bacterium]
MPDLSRFLNPRPRTNRARAALLAGVLSLAALAQVRAHPDPAAAPGNPAADSSASGLERALVKQGLENVTAQAGVPPGVAFENRRYRHSAEALAIVRAATGRPLLAFERRRGLVVAAIGTDERDSLARFRVHYPSDPVFPAPPASRLRSPTFARADLEIGARVDYRVGQIFDPIQLRIDLEPRLILNPWAGAALRLGILLPLQNDFPASDINPDLNRVRPGRMSLDQFVWLSRAALLSLSGGYFGDNRWGASLGAARPLAQGMWLLDVQVERTGFLAFTPEGALYSSPDLTSGFAGVTFRPPFADVSLRLRGAEFLYGDRGVDLELRRAIGDVEVGYFAQRIAGVNLYGVRLDLPVPPARRSTGSRLRVQPVPRFALSFRDRSEPIGTFVSGTASREDYLRQLSRPALDANSDRYRRALEGRAPERAPPLDWVSLTGMTGFINTPWAGVIADRGFEAGYNFIPRSWAYDHRGTNDNQVFYATLGFLSRVETALRWTRIPGYHSFEEIAPDSRLVDMDRMASGRIELLRPGPGRPALAVGIEDAEGTRRFHSTYAVAGLPFSFLQVRSRVSLGYGFRVFDATRYVLDGTFSAIDFQVPRLPRVQVEYDSEKWNAALGLNVFGGFRVRAALLHMESLSLGVGWSHSL